MKYVWKEKPSMMEQYAVRVWGVSTEGKTQEEIVLEGIQKTEDFYHSIGLVTRLSDAAEKAGVSTAYLSTLFSQHMGCGFVDYLNKKRIEYACHYMADGEMKIYEIAFKAGFRDEKYFSRVFKKIVGQSPSEYRKSIGVAEK